MSLTSNLMHLSPAQLHQVFAEHGVDTSKPETPEERETRHHRDMVAMNENYRKQQAEKQAERYKHFSLWPNDHPMTFTFADWKPDMQPDKQLAREVGLKAFNLANQLSQKQFNVFLYGRPGVGKTSLALAIMAEAKKQGLSTMFVSTEALHGLYRFKYEDPMTADRIESTFSYMKTVDLLVLDDFGTEGGSTSKIASTGYTGTHQDMQDDMYKLANARWDEKNACPKGHTVITTNNTIRELRRVYDPKTISRLVAQQKQFQINFGRLKDVRGLER